ncbi:hypothetical protein JHK86_001478 [Glycine max]|nr:hypothetical protein JHK86_001478 [Glycine max]
MEGSRPEPSDGTAKSKQELSLHLKEEYENVIKCVKVLRESANGNDEHSSLSVLAMKAWLGLGRHGEAKKELRGMVIDKGISERVWVSTVEAYFVAVGTTRVEIVKGVFLGLLGRACVPLGMHQFMGNILDYDTRTHVTKTLGYPLEMTYTIPDIIEARNVELGLGLQVALLSPLTQLFQLVYQDIKNIDRA